MTKIITRFPPSPTGFLHIGGLRTALYNYLLAKKNKGKFLLRIEDTDRKRYVEGAIEDIIDTLNFFKLKFDNEPVFQSQRLNVYKKAAQKLIDSGLAYYCFCTPERLEELHQKQRNLKKPTMYDKKCRDLTEQQVAEQLKNEVPYVIRLKMPENETIEFDDLIRGHVKFATDLLDDQILIKSDGFPTYHLASVVDDAEIGVTHVMRGEEWLSSTPKHIILYKFLNLQAPQFAHVPLLLNPDRSKLSKRVGDVAVKDYLEKGYLPEALLNFVLFLGWNPGDEREIFSLDEMVKEFSLEKINKSGAVFNVEKLDWINGQYIRRKSLEELANFAVYFYIKEGILKPIFRSAEVKPELTGYMGQNIEEDLVVKKSGEIISFDKFKMIIATEKERVKTLTELPEATKFFFQEPEYEKEMLVWKKADMEKTKQALDLIYNLLKEIDEKDFTADMLEKKVMEFIKANQLDTGTNLWPMRVALTGRQKSPGPFEVAAVLGKEKVLNRLKKAMEY
ncbi:glutamate--tRNA ligase [Candidatus Parcubacteria bacterium]|nr:MAG: glutamate--tRNA ligase [Candidatus Parcubacteria bacterium]